MMGGNICLKMPEKKSNREMPLKGIIPEKKSNREKPLKDIIAGRTLLKRNGQVRDSDVKSSGP